MASVGEGVHRFSVWSTFSIKGIPEGDVSGGGCSASQNCRLMSLSQLGGGEILAFDDGARLKQMAMCLVDVEESNL